MNTNVKQCLFGGALIGAGLCSPAVAGDFQWGSGGLNIVSAFFGGGNVGWDTLGGWDESSGGGYGEQYASSTGTQMGLNMIAYTSYTNPPQYGGGNAYARHGYGSDLDFTVSMDMMVNIDWDVSNDNYGSGFSYAYISDGMSNIFSMSSSINETGSTSQLLLAGETYYFRAIILSGPGAQGLSFFNMTGDGNINIVPLPPAAIGGLGMLAGLGVYRRVRR